MQIAPVSHTDIDKLKAAAATTAIQWNTYDANLTMTVAGGETTFQRTAYKEYDAALGQALTSGMHVWTVQSPNWTPNQYVGVSSKYVDKRTYPAGTYAYSMYMLNGSLCSGGASDDKSSKHMLKPPGLMKDRPIRNPQWVPERVPADTPVHVMLDMDERNLYLAIGDAEPQLAYSNLPASVHPYICSGEPLERSVMVVSSNAAKSADTGVAPPASRGWLG